MPSPFAAALISARVLVPSQMGFNEIPRVMSKLSIKSRVPLPFSRNKNDSDFTSSRHKFCLDKSG